ncbi:hypothetical protein MLOOGBEN_07420 [Bacillus sp. EB106-08-02-XG196]|uniref:hypothetical protein n=1 Tax=Bacillus sp. EB106-08-02-XG196 TaxID=2737049 RepID=UPI0015C4E18C|nr:hypothetical protein [Bacillus sp. EB106-08-02-XG196]NWQ40529.1 hypothetical protein [Bacillus sp. EB106-08-02-XG196]
MIVYHGSIRNFQNFNKETVVQNLSNDINTIGFWFTSNFDSAKPFATGSESVIEISKSEFWENGEPKVIQYERAGSGFIYKVYIDEPNLKIFESNTEDSFDMFMRERDEFCDYLGAKKRNVTWEDGAILLNKEEANTEFRKSLIKQGYEGLLIRKALIHNMITDLYCIFSQESLLITEVLPLEV